MFRYQKSVMSHWLANLYVTAVELFPYLLVSPNVAAVCKIAPETMATSVN